MTTEEGTTRRARKQRETPEERRLRARAAALTMHGMGKTNTGPARAAQWAAWEIKADPEGKLSPVERAKQAAQLQQAHMARMAKASLKARRERAS